jgi:hypothetical protein
MGPSDVPAQTSKRTDVGYGRPPRERQFKKGEKPPPRKKKDVPHEVPMSEAFRKVLEEERRVIIGGKAQWLTAADLIMKRAWQEAEKGSPTLRREVIRLMLSCEGVAPDQAPLVVTDPSKPASSTEFRLMLIDEDKR